MGSCEKGDAALLPAWQASVLVVKFGRFVIELSGLYLHYVILLETDLFTL